MPCSQLARGRLQEAAAALHLPLPEIVTEPGQYFSAQFPVFHTTVTCGGHSATGSGRTKKDAEADASEALLQLLPDYNRSWGAPWQRTFLSLSRAPSAAVAYNPRSWLEGAAAQRGLPCVFEQARAVSLWPSGRRPPPVGRGAAAAPPRSPLARLMLAHH